MYHSHYKISMFFFFFFFFFCNLGVVKGKSLNRSPTSLKPNMHEQMILFKCESDLEVAWDVPEEVGHKKSNLGAG